MFLQARALPFELYVIFEKMIKNVYLPQSQERERERCLYSCVSSSSFGKIAEKTDNNKLVDADMSFINIFESYIFEKGSPPLENIFVKISK